MVSRWSKAYAPASLMLFGEHSVLRFGSALVAAVDAYLSVEFEMGQDDQIHIQSALGEEVTSRFTIALSPRFRFLEAVLQSLQPIYTTGFTCVIRSDFPPTQGLGSSAALTIAAIGALQRLFDGVESASMLHARALSVIRHVQGRGSGADLAASLLGGVVTYSCEPRVSMEQIVQEIPLTICFSGYKTATPEVIRRVDLSEKIYPELVQGLLQQQAFCAEEAKNAIRLGLSDQLQFLTQASEGVMEGLGLSDPTLSQLVWLLRKDPGIISSKISGSGLGDCVIGFGSLHNPLILPLGCTLLPLKVSKTGLVVESEP